jgi:1-acyl-sn-glycerol-3-phosphate acyltransferase
MIQKIVYHTLKQYCKTALRFYFSHWQVQEIVPIPKGPVIFVSNHQNAFLDAILISCSSTREPWFLTRANVFNNNLAKKFLTMLQMSPVYRFRDGFNTLRKNDEVIENCVKLLSQQNSILIFGEGNHNDQWFLRPLQKGFARIAMAAEERNHWGLGVQIVPVGIQYESHTDFRSRVLVTFGNPISVKETYKIELSAPENIDLLLKKTSEGIQPLMLHIDPEHYESKLKFWRSNRQLKKDLIEQLKEDQKLVKGNSSPDLVQNKKEDKKSQSWWNPIRLYESINHFLPRFILRWILKTKVKDPQFIGSLKYALGMVLVPGFYVIQTSLCFAFSQSWPISVAYFLSLPVSILLRR